MKNIFFRRDYDGDEDSSQHIMTECLRICGSLDYIRNLQEEKLALYNKYWFVLSIPFFSFDSTEYKIGGDEFKGA